MKSNELEIGQKRLVYLWDINEYVSCEITNKYKDYKKTCWRDFCFDVKITGNKKDSTISSIGFIASAFKEI